MGKRGMSDFQVIERISSSIEGASHFGKSQVEGIESIFDWVSYRLADKLPYGGEK